MKISLIWIFISGKGAGGADTGQAEEPYGDRRQIFAKAGIIPQVRQVSRNLSTLDALAQVDYATVVTGARRISAALREREYFLIEDEYSVPFGFWAALMQGNYVQALQGGLLNF